MINKSSPVDLHCHSTFSDGVLTPAQLVRLAAERGLGALALTDHDTVAGVQEAADEAASAGLDFLPAIEISCAFPRPGTMHMLGYGIDIANPRLLAATARLAEARLERVEMIIHRLQKLGIDLSIDHVIAESGVAMPGRPHIALALKNRGYVATRREAFDRYLGGAGVAYVDNSPFTAEEAIDIIRDAGGTAVLAHPLLLRRATMSQLEAVVTELARVGLEGLEAMHGSHSIDDIHRLTRLADRVGVMTTGGSDFHGPAGPGSPLGDSGIATPAGGRNVPRSVFEQLIAPQRVPAAA